MQQIPDNSYVVIQAWMITKLGLSGAELMCYAAIHGFSQVGQGVFRGGVEYLMQWTGSSKPTVIRALQELARRGLIVRQKVGRSCEYSAVPLDSLTVQPEPPAEKVKNFNLSAEATGKNEEPDRLNNLTQIGKEILPVNINKEKTIENNTPPHTPPRAAEQADGIPTLEEVRSFARERNSKIDPDEFFQHYDTLHWKLYGEPIRDWQALFCKWMTDPGRQATGKKKPRALNYMHREEYSKEMLRARGVSLGEEFYVDDEEAEPDGIKDTA